jgi:hypothetical protein
MPTPKCNYEVNRICCVICNTPNRSDFECLGPTRILDLFMKTNLINDPIHTISIIDYTTQQNSGQN